MKKITSILSVLFLTSLMFGITLHAQIAGETCDDPLVITTLPFNDAGNTSTYGNNYTSTDIPPFASNAITNGNSTLYMSGDEVVYEYTPVNNEIITISVTGVGTYTGLYAFSGCPFASTVGSHTNSSAGTRLIPDMPVTGGVTYYFLISTWASPQSTAYDIEVTKLNDCSGTPVAGNITGPSTICILTAFDLEMDNPIAEGGISYQWQNSEDAGATWNDVTGATEPNYTPANGISVETDFRLIVNCATSNLSDTSNVLSIDVTSGSSCVCIPTGGGNNMDEIRNFTLSNLDNDSDPSEGTNGYSDYTQTVTPADLLAGLSYTASLTSGGGSGSHGAAIWIDYNDNGIFESSEKVAFLLSSITENSTVDFPPFVVPNTPGTFRLRVQYVYGKSGDLLDPCSTTTTYTETEDYMVNVLPPPTCIPPNTLIASNVLATTATVSWTGPSPAPGSGYEYYYSTSSTAPTSSTTASGTVTNATVDLTNLASETQYYFWARSVCSSNDISVWSSAETFTTPCTAETAPWFYDVESQGGTATNSVISGCWTGNPVYSTSVYAWNVSGTGTTPSSNTGPSSAYSGTKYFYTEASNGATNSEAELLTPMVDVSALNVPALEFYYHMYGSSMGDLYIEVSDGTSWTIVDSLIGEQQTAANDPWLKKLVPLQGYTGTIQVKFRSIKKASYYGDGAIDDIAIVEAPLACTGAPDAGIVSTVSSICAGIGFDLEGTEITELGITYQWQEAPSGTNTWTDIVGADNYDYNVSTGIMVDTDFRLIVTCTNTNQSDTSNEISVTLNAAMDCYCIPETTYSSDYTSAFSTTGATQDVTFTASANYAYEDLSGSDTIIVEAGSSVDFSHTYVGGNNNIVIWVDFDQNGDFDTTTEEIYASTSSTATLTGTLDIPANTVPGTYRFRLRSQYGSTVPGPCNVANWGSAIDYTIVIQGLCTDPIVDLGPDVTVCEGESITLDAGNAGLDFEWNDNSTGQTLEVSTAGTYYVTVTDDDCSTTDTIVVTVQDLPIVDLGGDVTICDGESITLDAGNAGADFEWNDNSTGQTLDVTDEGTYTVTVTEGTCFASDTVEVSYIDAPTADGIIANEQDDCFYTFSVDNAQNATYYEWDFGDGSPSTIGASVNHTYTTNGAFIVTLTMVNDCEDTLSLTHELACSGIGIDEVIADKNAITLYPNPTTDLVTIESENNLSMKQVTVYNALGQTVYQNAPMSQFKHTVDVSKMASGVYTIHVQTNNGVIIRKFEIIK